MKREGFWGFGFRVPGSAVSWGLCVLTVTLNSVGPKNPRTLRRWQQSSLKPGIFAPKVGACFRV